MVCRRFSRVLHVATLFPVWGAFVAVAAVALLALQTGPTTHAEQPTEASAKPATGAKPANGAELAAALRRPMALTLSSDEAWLLVLN